MTQLRLEPVATIGELVENPRALVLYTEQGEPIFGIGIYRDNYEIMLRDPASAPKIVPADEMLYAEAEPTP